MNKPYILFLILITIIFTGCTRDRASITTSTETSAIINTDNNKGVSVLGQAIVKVIKDPGGRVDWSKGGKIAFDKLGADGYYDIYTMNEDTSDEVCLTCNNPLFKKHQGNPAWHPSNEWIVFQSEKLHHLGSSDKATPGFGTYNDLWITNSSGTVSYPLVTVTNNADNGILHPHFSGDGKRLSWSQMYQGPGLSKQKSFGYWKIKTADFTIVGGKPTISNIKEYNPGGEGLYENHGFSPDNQYILFTSNRNNTQSIFEANDIYTLEIKTNRLNKLTTNGYNEHAGYLHNGKKIIWMTNTGNPNRGTDWWMMNTDGSNKTRITDMNNSKSPNYLGSKSTAADFSLSSDDTKFVGYVQNDLIKQTGKIVVVTFSINRN